MAAALPRNAGYNFKLKVKSQNISYLTFRSKYNNNKNNKNAVADRVLRFLNETGQLNQKSQWHVTQDQKTGFAAYSVSQSSDQAKASPKTATRPASMAPRASERLQASTQYSLKKSKKPNIRTACLKNSSSIPILRQRVLKALPGNR